MTMISPHLGTHETVCPCGCGRGGKPDQVSGALADLFEGMRGLLQVAARKRSSPTP
jgi:hypothetical protein